MKRLMLMLAITALLVVPNIAEAQACYGVPTGSRSVLALGIGFPSGGKIYSASGFARLGEGGLLAGASYSLMSPDMEGVKNSNAFGTELAYEIRSIVESASVCPSVGVAYESWGDLKTTQIPLGFNIGKTFPVGNRNDVTLTPSASPYFLWARYKFLDETESETYFGLVGGATLGIGNFLVRGSVGKIFEEGTDAVFTIGIGLRL